jgi:hypothetical protein
LVESKRMKRRMTYRNLIVAGYLALAVAGCGENKPPATSNSVGSATAAQPPKNASDKTTVAAPIAPTDARLTLYCTAVAGPNHVARAKMLKDQVVEKTGLKDFYIIHSDEDSVLYYGYYKDFIGNQNTKEKQRAEADRRRIAELADAADRKPFHSAMFVDISTSDPQGQPEWNLVNTPPDKKWTLLIASYVDSPQRKQAAVEAVRAARAMGVEAYYYHGETASTVSVGAFPEDALKRQETDAAKTYDSDEPFVVLSTPLPAGVSNDVYVNQDGKRVKVRAFAPRVEPVDPQLIALKQEFPIYSINGEESVRVVKDPKTGKQIERKIPSVVVEIKRQQSALAGPPQPTFQPPVVPSAGQGTRQPSGISGGGLRSLSD